jgi:glycosyltransferase involved in cell wall biosynthesis
LWKGWQRHLITVHDMTFFSLPECHIPLRRSILFRFAIKTSIRRAHLILTPSRFTAQQVLNYMPEISPNKIRVVPHGVNEEFRIYAPEEIRANRIRLDLPVSYILYVGTIEPRKNLAVLVDAYKRLIHRNPDVPSLVIAGRLGWDYEGLLSKLDSSELRGRVHLAGYVCQQDLPWYYAAASLFVYPSVQEGFGFPPLEAMACGIPVISSNTSSLDEILRGAAELVDTQKMDALAEAMDRVLRDSAQRSYLREKGLAVASQYRWEATARKTLQCYHALQSTR